MNNVTTAMRNKLCIKQMVLYKSTSEHKYQGTSLISTHVSKEWMINITIRSRMDIRDAHICVSLITAQCWPSMFHTIPCGFTKTGFYKLVLFISRCYGIVMGL